MGSEDIFNDTRVLDQEQIKDEKISESDSARLIEERARERQPEEMSPEEFLAAKARARKLHQQLKDKQFKDTSISLEDTYKVIEKLQQGRDKQVPTEMLDEETVAKAKAKAEAEFKKKMEENMKRTTEAALKNANANITDINELLNQRDLELNRINKARVTGERDPYDTSNFKVRGGQLKTNNYSSF